MTPLPEVLCSQANIQLPTRDQGQAGWHASQGVRTGTFTCVGANKSQEDISIFIYTWNPPMGVSMSIFQHLKLPWECFELSFSFELDLRLFTVIVLELTNSKLAAGLPASSLIKVQCISFQIQRGTVEGFEMPQDSMFAPSLYLLSQCVTNKHDFLDLLLHRLAPLWSAV